MEQNNEQIFEVIEGVEEEIMSNSKLPAFLNNETFKKSAIGIGITALVTGAVVAGTIIVRKNKEKITDWMIKRWEKKGYTVIDMSRINTNESEDLGDILSEFDKK